MITYVIYRVGLFAIKNTIDTKMIDSFVPNEYKNWRPGNICIYNVAKYATSVALILI